jgi:GAF domain-containing protein
VNTSAVVVEASLDLEPATRDQLAPARARVARLERALPQIRSVLADETDAVALQASLACLLWDAVPQVSWCGFYRRIGDSTLAVGPYQGTLGCLRIEFARGVCGAAARTKQVQLVPDVQAFDGHIACDARTRSELVVPVVAGGQLRAVLDLDSALLDAFCTEEAELLQALIGATFDRPNVVW